MRTAKANFRWLYLLFFVSGFPALIYQIVWQRALFTIYGVNIESVTVVVSAFMLGLGLGSLAGGWLSRRRDVPLLVVFGLMELGIAAFGLVSLSLFHWIGAFTLGAQALETGAVSFGLVVVPTILMGATLPLLVEQLVRISGNVGGSVGILYCVNTLGSAVACFVAALVTMRYLGLTGSVRVAATLNVLVGLTVLGLHFRWHEKEETVPRPEPDGPRCELSFPAAMAIAALAGFISLGYEIVWYRVYSFVSEGSARSFAFVLGAFLAGIAFGSLGAGHVCRSRKAPLLRLIGLLVLCANLAGFFAVPLVAGMVTEVSYLLTLPLVALSAGLLGATFPFISHVSIAPDANPGARLSYLYLSNIIGSTLGSYLVGFVLMDFWPLRGIAVFLTILGVATAVALIATEFPGARGKVFLAVCGGLVILSVVASSAPLFATVYERLQFKSEYSPRNRFTDVVENRSGVITVDKERNIYSSGRYDGMLVTGIDETDTVLRPFALSYFHPAPKDVLIVGMAGGAWAEVIVNNPWVERAVIVEINPGYFKVIPRYPEVAPLLRNPKAEFVVDDGRRWMVRNRGQKFDVIVMDNIAHWRAHATNLLSIEFLMLVREMLKPGGVLYYNTTYSNDAQWTGVTVFPYALRFGPLLAVSDSPLQLDRNRWRDTLAAYRLDGRPILDLADADDRDRLNEVLACTQTEDQSGREYLGMESAASIRRRTRGGRIVTDDNMATEWRR